MSVLDSNIIAASVPFDGDGLPGWLAAASDADLDSLDFGAIGFDAAGVVVRYNCIESAGSGLSPQTVLSHPLFTMVAPCMNNFLVAERFDDALASGESLDATISYVLTLRMRPTKVKLRLLAIAGANVRWVLIHRLG